MPASDEAPPSPPSAVDDNEAKDEERTGTNDDDDEEAAGGGRRRAACVWLRNRGAPLDVLLITGGCDPTHTQPYTAQDLITRI
jgi:hypothetical protein